MMHYWRRWVQLLMEALSPDHQETGLPDETLGPGHQETGLPDETLGPGHQETGPSDDTLGPDHQGTGLLDETLSPSTGREIWLGSGGKFTQLNGCNSMNETKNT